MNQSPEHPARVLIVDDESVNRRLLEVMLKPEGFVLLTAASGEEALEVVAQQSPDLILLDVMMPGIDGYQVTARIKSNPATKNIPIIMVTVLNDRTARMNGLTAGAEDFLSKPVDHAELCARVRNLLRLKAYGDYYDNYSDVLEREVVLRTADLLERTKTLEQQAMVLAEQAALLDLAQDAIVVRDMHGQILFWNRGAEVMYGWPRADALGRDTRELLNTQFSEPAEAIDATLARLGQWEGEAIHHTRDGRRLTVASRWALQRSIDGAPVQVLSIDNDITDRKHAEAERLSLTERLSLATAVARVGVWEWDLASNAVRWDDTMFDIYGLPAVVPMPYERWSAAVHAEDLPGVEAIIRKAIAEKGQGSVDYRIRRTDGCIRHVSAVANVILDGLGNVSRLIGVNMDVTERIEAEAASEQSRGDQLRFKDDFLSHVSHELRSPLTAIKQFTSILLGGVAGELNTDQREYNQIIMKNIRQLQSMIDDLLEVTRLETGKLTVEPESLLVSPIVTDTLHVLQMTATAKGVTFSCDLPQDLPSALADQTRFRQILIILLDNAIKFSTDGGVVKIQARVQPDDPQFLLFEVSDTGCGISHEMADRLFERLYQVPTPDQGSRKGLGLGLYICKELVTRQGGRIWFTRHLDKGSSFLFTLPVFSLSKLIAPLFKSDNWPSESVAIVAVEIGLLGASASKESQEEWSHQSRSLLQRCLLPDLDVLMPNVSSRAEGERFFVAAFADEPGAALLANRIREQFERHGNVKQTGLKLSVSYSMLHPPRPAGAPLETIVTTMATHLEESIKSQMVRETVYHEQ